MGLVAPAYRNTLQVTGTMWNYVSSANDTMFNVTFFTDEISGRVLGVDTDYDSHIHTQNQYWPATITLELDGQQIPLSLAPPYVNNPPSGTPQVTSRGAPTTMTLHVDHPYAAQSGAYLDTTITKDVVLITPLTIVAAWGDIGPGLLARWSSMRAQDKSPPYLLHPPNGCDDSVCQNFYPGSVGDLAREKEAAGWLAQYTKAAHLHAQIAKSVVQLHHELGFVYGDAVLNPQYSNPLGDPDWVLADNFDRLDVDSAFSLSTTTSTTTSAATRRGAVQAIAASSSALEGSMGAQQADAPDTTSTATRFEWGNAPPAAEDPSPGNLPRTFYQFDSTNFSSSEQNNIKVENGVAANNGLMNLGQQPQLGTADIGAYHDELVAEIQNYTNNGFEVVASQEAFLGPGQRGGVIAYATDKNGHPVGYGFQDSKQRGGAFVATKYDTDNVTPLFIAHDVVAPSLLQGFALTKGGGAGSEPDSMTSYSPSDPADVTKSRFVDKSHALGVSLQNGSLSSVTGASLTVGKGGAPFSLSASLSYDAAPQAGGAAGPAIPTQPSGGWVNNWQNNLALSGSGLEALGSSDPRAAAGAIVAFMAAQDIYANNNPSPQRDAAAVLTQAWWAHQMSGNVATVSLGTASHQFVKLANGAWQGTGGGAYEKLVQTGTRAPYEYICFFNNSQPYAMARGWNITSVSFDVYDAGGNDQHFANWTNNYTGQGPHACAQARGFRLTTWTFANGVVDTVTYGNPVDALGDGGTGVGIESLVSVANSLGRKINLTLPSGTGTQVLFDNNLSGADARSVSVTGWIGGTSVSFSDPMGKLTTVALAGGVAQSWTQNAIPYGRPSQIFTADHPTLPAIEYDYDTLGRIDQIRDAINLQIGDHTVTGGRDPTQFFIADGYRGERDDPLGEAYSVYYDPYNHPSRYIDELGRETDQVADGLGRVTTTTYPEGDQEVFTYDGRNNPLSRTLVPKTGSAEKIAGKTLSVSVTYTEGPTHFACTTITTCNKPLTSVSANGWTTNYTWNSNGTLSKVQLPTTGTAGRPETDYGYTGYTANGATFSLLTSKVQYVSRSPIVKTETDYAYNASNDYVPSTVTVDPTVVDPTGLNLVTTLTYDPQGDVINVKGPRTDIDTTSYFTYDLDRRNLLAIGPDPDGTTSGNKRVTTKKIYDDAGHLLETDRGTANTTTGSDFLSNNWIKEAYDPDFNKILETTGPDDSSGNPLAATTAAQFTYDGANRLLCTARRMNPVQYGNWPSDACTLGPAGSYGPDRITETIYDAAGQARQEIRAFGTSAQQVYATRKFEPDGKEIAIADADAGLQIGVQYADALNATASAAHQTNYAYDGFDRPITTTYADNTTDQVTSYDNDGNPLTHINRAGQSLTYTYDKLDRMATKVVPAASTIPQNTITWTYDLINEVTNLADTNGNVLANTYDLGGRQLTASQTLPGMATTGAQTVTYSYDNGTGDKVDRSKIIWPDGYFVSYGYDATGNMTSATDSDGTALAARTYDNLGRPATQQYPFANDNISWSWGNEDDMLSLANNFAGSANDVTYTNTAFNPAHQIVSVTISNAAYKYAVSNNGTDAYAAPNGLNQYTSMTPAGGSAPPANGTDCTAHAEAISYDCNGNLTGDGTLTLAYDPENRLMSASKTGMNASYLYDPLGRRTTKNVTGSNGGVTNFLHDGDTEIAEYDGTGAIVRRFVPGPAVDQSIAMITCTGAGCAGANATKTMFHVDKLGSVVAMSKASNGQLATNGGPFLYDAYGNCMSGGLPCSTAGTPYLFTGQRLDPETGLYYFRARYYSSATGRMLQTDPVGYAVDVDAYTYGGDDPTDQTDPSGMAATGCGSNDKGEKPSSTGTCGPSRPDGGCGSRISGGGDLKCRLNAGTYKRGALEAKAPLPPVVPVAEPPVWLEPLLQFVPVVGVLAAVSVGLCGDTQQACDGQKEEMQREDDGGSYLLHYTNNQGRDGIATSGVIQPSGDGNVYVTPQVIGTGAAAKSLLALRQQPTGYFRIPIKNFYALHGPGIVQKMNNEPGGGFEIKNYGPVSAAGATWVGLSPGN